MCAEIARNKLGDMDKNGFHHSLRAKSNPFSTKDGSNRATVARPVIRGVFCGVLTFGQNTMVLGETEVNLILSNFYASRDNQPIIQSDSKKYYLI